MIECFELAICILSNSAACLAEKMSNELEQIGRICSIVFDFSPNSMKALFRRAMVAIEVGKKDWVYW